MFKLERTKTLISELSQIDFETMKHPEMAMHFDFTGIVKTVNYILDTVQQIDKADEEIKISKKSEEDIQSVLNTIKKNVVDKSISFILKDNAKASEEYKAICNNSEDSLNKFIDFTRPLINSLDIQTLSPEKVKKLIDDVKSSQKDFEEKFTDVYKKVEGVETSLTEIRQASGVQAATISAKNFLEQSDEHKSTAKLWLFISVGSSLGLVFLIFALFNRWFFFANLKVEDTSNNYEIIQIVVFKLILLSAAYFWIHQSIKNYRIHRHLYVMNKHRHNALSVYPQMLIAGEDSEVRNTITAEAARSIFEPTNSGYLGNDDDPRPVNPTAIVNKIIEKKA